MDAFYGEIRAFPYTYAPNNWLECMGQELQAIQYQALYAVIGNLYGGNGPTTFKLPDLRGVAAMHFGSYVDSSGGAVYTVSQLVGVDTVTLSAAQVPPHDHTMQTRTQAARLTAPSDAALIGAPLFTRLSATSAYPIYNTSVPNTQLTVDTVSPQGGDAAHDNHQPFLVMRYCMCVDDAIFPIRP